MLKAWFVRWQIQRAINAAWSSSHGAEARQQLFPEGKPTPEQFIKTVAEQVKRERDGSQVPDAVSQAARCRE